MPCILQNGRKMSELTRVTKEELYVNILAMVYGVPVKEVIKICEEEYEKQQKEKATVSRPN